MNSILTEYNYELLNSSVFNLCLGVCVHETYIIMVFFGDFVSCSVTICKNKNFNIF